MQCPELFSGDKVVEEVVANIDVAPTVMQAMGLEKPAHMDGQSFIPLAEGKQIPWREYFLYTYYWEKNFPQSPTVFSLRGEQFKYITYYGLWDTDELYDIKNDPGETKNLLHDPEFEKTAKQMESKLYKMMAGLGGMEVPLNAPGGYSSNKRLRGRKGDQAADFPDAMVVDDPINTNAN